MLQTLQIFRRMNGQASLAASLVMDHLPLPIRVVFVCTFQVDSPGLLISCRSLLLLPSQVQSVSLWRMQPSG